MTVLNSNSKLPKYKSIIHIENAIKFLSLKDNRKNHDSFVLAENILMRC